MDCDSSARPGRPWAAAATLAAGLVAVAVVLLRGDGVTAGGLAAVAAVGLAALVPGVLAAPRSASGGSRPLWRGRLSDFLLVGVVGLVTLHVYLLAVTGRPTWFYGWLLLDVAAWRWAGSGGLTPNLGLFVPVGVAMGLAMAAARVAVGALRRVWLPGLAYAGLLVAAVGLAVASAARPDPVVPGPTGWERALPEVEAAGEAAPVDTVLFVLESLRADALDAETMPRAAAFAGRGLTLGRHHAGANSSVLGLYGLLSGRPAAHAVADLAAGTRPPLLAAAQRRGHRLAWFGGGPDAAFGGFDRLMEAGRFDRVSAGAGSSWEESDARAIDDLLEALAEPDRPPLFAVVFLVATHFDYPPPAGGDTPFTPAAGDATLLVPWTPGSGGRHRVMNRYRNAVHAADARLGRCLDRIDLATTRVALTGDHGQSLGDDGTIGHWSRLSDAQTRVPFALAGPGVPRGVILTTTAHADAAALLLDAMAGRPIDLNPVPRPTLLVQSNPHAGTEDWLVIDGDRRTAWLRSADGFRRRGSVGAAG